MQLDQVMVSGISTIPGISLTNPSEKRLPGIISIVVDKKDFNNERFIKNISDKFALSTGSACSAGEPSYVITALGLEDRVSKVLRISLNKYTTEEEIHQLMMIDKKPEYKGESKVWEILSDNLPGEAIVYNGREVNGREFDFCILMKNIGMIVIEVKGWIADSIFDVAGVDEIIIQGYDKPEKSPKKQARAYRFGLLNMISDKYNVSPLIFDLVCYPFITKKEYYEKRLDIVSEETLTLFKEDLSDPIKLGDKLLNAYNQCKSIPHTEMDGELMADYNFKQLILNLKQMVDEVNLAVENSDFRPSANVISALKSFLGVCEKVVQTGVANNATTQYISFESKKLYTVIGQEWSEFYLKATANILSLLDTVKGIIPDENKAIYATNKIKKASSWNVTIDNYNYLKQGIAEADKILEDLDLDEDSEILAFLKLVSEGKATILNLTDEILAWIKAENLADKMFINF